MKKFFLYITLFLFYSSMFGQSKLTTTPKAQVSTWGTLNFGDDINSQLGARVIPQLNFEKTFKSKIKLDAETSANTTGYLTFEDWKKENGGEGFQPYRLWLRMSAEKWEVRAGLQKINFGSASMLRPLMWFDQIDPRDPLQLTNGVYGLLGRYYFKNNANLWLWTLYGNENPRGWDYVGTKNDKPEFGGRFQFPFLKGELAISYNERKVKIIDIDPSIHPGYDKLVTESKIGIDGKWDLGIGLWFESSLSDYAYWQLKVPMILLNNLGVDYTIGIGNGLNIIYEQLFYSKAYEGYKFDEIISFSILSLRYPIGMFDNLSVMAYYNWENGDWYRFINYNRNYDNWTFYLMAFWNPNVFALYNTIDEINLFAGKGLQLMAVYNF